jgi:hypothetical protein
MVKKSHKITIGNMEIYCILAGVLLVVLFLQSSYPEGFTLSGDSVNDVTNSKWVKDALAYSTADASNKRSDYKGTVVPLMDEGMFYFKGNQFKPECCPATYSNSMGCACMSEDQKKYLTKRGGNRTFSSKF